MPNIYFLWATIRPEMMFETYKHWMNTRSLDSNVIVKAAVYTDEQKNLLESYNIPNCDVVVVNDKRGYTHAVTKLTTALEANDEDIILLISDDFYSPFGWDEYLFQKFNSFDGGLFIDDGYQDPKVKDGIMLALTITCLTFSCIKKLNRVVLHPDYNHFFSDNEIFQNLKALGMLKDDRDIDNMIFEHRNCHLGKRERDNYDDYYLENRQTDEATFYRRMKISLEERLRL